MKEECLLVLPTIPNLFLAMADLASAISIFFERLEYNWTLFGLLCSVLELERFGGLCICRFPKLLTRSRSVLASSLRLFKEFRRFCVTSSNSRRDISAFRSVTVAGMSLFFFSLSSFYPPGISSSKFANPLLCLL